MACTVAVEALVTKHYDDQVTEMVSNNPKLDENLIKVIKQFPRRRAEPPRYR